MPPSDVPNLSDSSNPPAGPGRSYPHSLFGRLATWSDSEIPLPEMLRALAEEQSKSSRQGLLAMATHLEQGADLPTAFQKSENKFPKHLRQQLSMAANTGDLRLALPVLADQDASRQAVRQRLTSVLAYPVLVLCFAFALLVFGAIVTIPPFEEMYDEFQLELPFATEFVFLAVHYLPWIVGTMVIGVGLFSLLAVLPFSRRIAHWFATAVPLFGSVWIWLGHQSLANQLAFYLHAGVPLPRALESIAQGLGDRNLARCVKRLAKECDGGLALSEGMAKSIHFERALVSFVQTGEHTSDLPAALADACDLYRNHIGHQITFIHAVVPPCVVLLVACGVCFTAVALFLPLTKLIEGLT